ncbi:MAG: UDP-2,3-diacylglucosamine diphosphatase LpxI domain-containing protein [Myxococcota bacterium]
MAEGRVGLIAGGGALPGLARRCLVEAGFDVAVLGFEGITEPALAPPAAHLRLGQVEALVSRMRTAQVDSLLMVGRFDPALAEASAARLTPDATARRLFEGMAPGAHVAWMSAVADFLEAEGLPLARQDVLLAPLLARRGPLGASMPGPTHHGDLAAGRREINAQAASVLGQAVAIKEGCVVARETPAGTDALIREAGRVAGNGFVIVKAARPGQDPRLDLPAIGPTTIAALAEAGGAGLAIEAERTIVIDAPRVAAEADRCGVIVWAFDPDETAGGH